MFPNPALNRKVVCLGIGFLATSICVISLQIRPLGILFLALFFFWCFKTQSNLQVIQPPELQAKITAMSEKVRQFRKSNPTAFCSVAVGILAILAIFGHIVSGTYVVLGGLIVAAIISTKYNFKIVKLENKDFTWKEKCHDNDVDDEFLPEENESNLFVLERASDLATISSPMEDADEKSDDIPSELLIPDSIPEIGESDSSDDELLIKSPPNKTISKKEIDIEFKRGHFKKDSSISTSSSSDEELSKGLCFPEHTVVDASNPHQLGSAAQFQLSQTASLIATSNILPSLMSGIVSWSSATSAPSVSRPNKTIPDAATKSNLESSDDSDFEILESDDFK